MILENNTGNNNEGYTSIIYHEDEVVEEIGIDGGS